MTHLRQLLAVTDFSAPSRHAAERAAMIAREQGAALELMHVQERRALDHVRELFGSDDPAVLTQLHDQAHDALTTIGAHLHQRHGVGASLRVDTTPLLQGIVDRADALDAELIALGARGAGFVRRAVLGGTAERLLRKLTRPLLVVRQTPHVPYQRLLVAVDFSSWSLPAVQLARQVAPAAQIVLLNVFDVPMEGMLRIAGVADSKIAKHREQMRQSVLQQLGALSREAGLGADTVCIAIQGDPVMHILEQEQEQDIDLIVVGKHGTGMTEELLLGSVTRDVLNQADSDVLVAQYTKKS